MSIQKKIVYVVVIILAVIGLLSILPAPTNSSETLNVSEAMEPIDDFEQVREGGQGIPFPEGGGGGGGWGVNRYYPSAWEWGKDRVQLGQPYYRICAYLGLDAPRDCSWGEGYGW